MPDDKALISKLADVPLAKPGFDALGMSAPILVQMNPDGKWESSAPKNLDEERLKLMVDHLVSTKAVSAAQSYCTQCASENKMKSGGNAKYVPVIMMPIFPANQCPFDMDCEVQKIKESEGKATKKATKQTNEKEESKETKKKKRGYVLQRLTDFDLLSQW